MGKKTSFVLGVGVGVLAAVAAKIAYDNKEEIMEAAEGGYSLAKDELNSFVDYSMEKLEGLSTKIVEKAEEYKGFASEQLDQFKSIVKEAQEELNEEINEEINDIEE